MSENSPLLIYSAGLKFREIIDLMEKSHPGMDAMKIEFPFIEPNRATVCLLTPADAQRITLPLPMLVLSDVSSPEQGHAANRTDVPESADSGVIAVALAAMARAATSERQATGLMDRLDSILELSRHEQIESKSTEQAYLQLLQYEERLIEENRRINQALLLLESYRDKERGDWEREKNARESFAGMVGSELREKEATIQARETIEELMQQEMRQKDQTLAARETLEQLMSDELREKNVTINAQEELIQYFNKEKMVYQRIVEKFNEKGTISARELRTLLDQNSVLMNQLQKLTLENP